MKEKNTMISFFWGSIAHGLKLFDMIQRLTLKALNIFNVYETFYKIKSCKRCL